MVGLSNVTSRHNTPSAAHFLTKMVQAEKKSGKQTAVVVCPHILVGWARGIFWFRSVCV